MAWTDKQIEELKNYHDAGLSCAQIGRRIRRRASMLLGRSPS